MIGDISRAEHIFIACGYTDMRKSIDGLAACVKQISRMDPFANNLYLLCGRRCGRLKALYWEGDGFVLLYKRLERGIFQWPRDPKEAKQITGQQLRRLLEGLSIEQPKAIRPVSGLSII